MDPSMIEHNADVESGGTARMTIRAFLLHPTAFGDWVRHAFFVVTHSS
jgi:hypothetical protein